MGYCTYGGKLVPGNNQASCIGGGGNWVEDVAPIQRGGVQIMHPDSQANTEQLTNLFQSMPGVGSLGKAIPRIGATNVPKFTGQANTIQQVQKAVQPVARQTDKLLPSRLPPTTGIFNKASEKVAGQLRKHPIMATTAAATPVVSLMVDDGPVTDKKAVQQGSASPLFTRQQLKARNIALNEAKASGDTATVNKILKAETAPTEAYTKAKSGTPWAQLAAGAKVTDADQMALDSASQTPEPANKEKVESGLSSLWSNMQKPGYWSEQVEGGAGDWDNRLFRLGEMMSYMGTPLSKRGDNPAKRWTSASSAAAKLKADADKASGSTADFWKNVSASDMNETTLLKIFTPESGGFFGDSKIEATQKGAARVAAYVSKRAELIQGGSVPTHQDVMDALSGKKKDK